MMKKTKPPKNKPNCIWLYGLHPVFAALENTQRKHQFLVYTKNVTDKISQIIKQHPTLKSKLMEENQLSELLPFGAVHQGIALETSPIPELTLEEAIDNITDENTSLVILDNVTDPHNIGAILRTAAAFGAAFIIVQDYGTPNTTGVMAKSACGALEIVPIIRTTNLSQALEKLKKAGFWCLGLAEGGTNSLEKSDLKGRIAFVLGAEGKGIRKLVKENCDDLIYISTDSRLPTLNVSNAAAVALYEYKRQQV